MTDKKENPFEEPVEIDVETPAADSGAESPEPGDQAGEGEAGNRALEAAQADLARHKEAMLRMQADMDNLRKRLMRDLERSRKLALEGFMKDLLQIRDSMERGLEVAADADSVEPLIEGQELTLKMLGKVMTDHNLEAIDPAGEAFDPEFHEAMTVLPSPDHEENTVLEVIQKGYRLHDRLIRPARVVVSRKP